MVDLTKCDDKILIVIGNLLRRAEPIPKSVLSAFGPSKDLHINLKRAGKVTFYCFIAGSIC